MRTPLYDRHLALGAKIVPFAGWEMPVQYQGILAEHQAVRTAVGLFDVSHMGRIHVRGGDAERLLDYLSTSRIVGKSPGSATYTVWCHSHGGSVDDVIVCKVDHTHFFVIANAGNRDKDLAHLTAYATLLGCDVAIEEAFNETGILALQGPKAVELLGFICPQAAALRPMHLIAFKQGGKEVFISRTGYTGADGFEIFGSSADVIDWWDLLLEQGAAYGIQPTGLGARDTLRLEMGFALYGHELTDVIAPSESVSAWTVKWDKSDFLGKRALEQLEQSASKRHAYGVKLMESGIPRQGYPVLKGGVPIGLVTSGSFSPVLEEGIALILVNTPLKVGHAIDIQIRQNLCPAQVANLPFVKKLSSINYL